MRYRIITLKGAEVKQHKQYIDEGSAGHRGRLAISIRVIAQYCS